MSNALYVNFRQLMMGVAGAAHALPDLDADTLKVHLVDAADHTTNLATDVDEADVTDAAIVETFTLANNSVVAGVLDADDATEAAVSGDEAEELVLWQDTATDTTSPLIARFDTFTAGMPLTPNGGPVDIEWNAGGILTLAP